MRLASNRAERQYFDNLADVYALVIALEHLETAYIRDSIPVADYEAQCGKVIAQLKAAQDKVRENYPSLEKFLADFRMNCPAAAKRLKIGVPANIEYGGAVKGKDDKAGVYVAQAVQHFITTLDAIKLEMTATDELVPHLKELMDSLNKIPSIPPNHISKEMAKKWLLVLGEKRASDKLDAEQARQFAFDVENAYNEFHTFLKDH